MSFAYNPPVPTQQKCLPCILFVQYMYTIDIYYVIMSSQAINGNNFFSRNFFSLSQLSNLRTKRHSFINFPLGKIQQTNKKISKWFHEIFSNLVSCCSWMDCLTATFISLKVCMINVVKTVWELRESLFCGKISY